MKRKKNSRILNLGIVGAGFISQVAHIRNYVLNDRCRIVALADLRPKLREAVAKHFGIMRTYPSHKELLDDPEVEAVVAVTPRPLIGPIAYDCLCKGKHLITEKPMAGTLAQAKRLVDVAKKNRLCYVVGYMRRHDEGVQLARNIISKLLETGELGPITYVRQHCFLGEDYCKIDGDITTGEEVPADRPKWPIAPDWVPHNRKKDYAWFLNVHSHDINLLRFLLGACPIIDYVRFDHKDGRVALLDFGKYEAVLETGNFHYSNFDGVTEIYFAHGRLKIEVPPSLLRNLTAKVELYRGNDEPHFYLPHTGWSWSFRRQADAFIANVLEGGKPIASGSDALEDMRLIEEMWRMAIKRVK